MMRRWLSWLGALALVGSLTAPAGATLSPVITLTNGGPNVGQPGSLRIVTGYVTMGSADTYVTGGFTVSPAQLGFGTSIAMMDPASPSGAFEVVPSISSGIATVKFLGQLTGTSFVTAAATTKVVTPGVTISANTPILCQLDDSATSGGGTGTWSVTNAVSTCDYTSATTFTLTSIAAAPTNGGNFVWMLPTVSAEITAGTSVASYVIPFVAAGI